MHNEASYHNWIDRLPADVREAVRDCMHKRRLAPGESVYRCGESAEALYQVVEGELEAIHVSAEGKELLLILIYPGDCFGESGLIDGSKRLFNTSARHMSTVAVLPGGHFARLRDQHPAINHELLRAQTARLQITMTAIAAYALQSLRQRILRRLTLLAGTARQQPDGRVLIQTGLSQKEYGKLFGASRQSVNKELNLMQQQHLIELCKNGILIYCVDDLLKASLEGP
jgi:CRP-like cAMP-binding protein